MSNKFLKPNAITREALRILHNKLAFIRNVDKQHDKETTYGGQKRGASIRIRQPNQYTVRTGSWTLNAQDQNEQSVTLTIGNPYGVDMYFTDADLATEIDEFSNRFIEPAMNVLASKIDSAFFNEMYKSVYQSVGTPGTTPATALVYLQGGQKLDEAAAPTNPRVSIINPAAQASTVNGLSSLFNPAPAISKQYLDGAMGRALGFDFNMSQNVPLHTTGSRVGTILVDEPAGTNLVEGTTTIHVDGLTNATDTWKEGDVLTFADVYAVNPETKMSTGALKQFVVTADATAASNEVDLTISPAMYSTGALKNVDALPVDNAAVTVVGSASTQYPQNMVFCKDAFTFATANLEMPGDVTFKSQQSMDGINMRILRQYDINNAAYPCRIDVFWGGVAQRAELAARVWG